MAEKFTSSVSGCAVILIAQAPAVRDVKVTTKALSWRLQ
jgi:hypothetical protein